jgi:hypothetical protein
LGKVSPVELESAKMGLFQQASVATPLNGQRYPYTGCVRIFAENVGRETTGTTAVKARLLNRKRDS